MYKRTLLLLLGVAATLGLSAQNRLPADTTSPWNITGAASVNFTQAGYWNWAAGGENAISLAALGNLGVNYEKEKVNWDQVLDAQYGIIRQGDAGVQKNLDQLNYLTKAGWKFKPNWLLSGRLNYRTQFATGFDPAVDTADVVISRFMAPGYIELALGIEWRPKKWISIFLTPVSAGKFTFVRDQPLADAGQYGVAPAEFDTNGVKIQDGKRFRAEFGGLLGVLVQWKDKTERFSIQSRLDAFMNYSNPVRSERKYVDVNWETLIGIKVTSWLQVNVTAQLLYDFDIKTPIRNDAGELTGEEARVQFREIVGVGLGYTFGKKKDE